MMGSMSLYVNVTSEKIAERWLQWLDVFTVSSSGKQRCQPEFRWNDPNKEKRIEDKNVPRKHKLKKSVSEFGRPTSRVLMLCVLTHSRSVTALCGAQLHRSHC